MRIAIFKPLAWTFVLACALPSQAQVFALDNSQRWNDVAFELRWDQPKQTDDPCSHLKVVDVSGMKAGNALAVDFQSVSGKKLNALVNVVARTSNLTVVLNEGLNVAVTASGTARARTTAKLGDKEDVSSLSVSLRLVACSVAP
jgi:hypothetical protein